MKNEDENIAINMWSTVGFKTEFGTKLVETLRIALYNCDYTFYASIYSQSLTETFLH